MDSAGFSELRLPPRPRCRHPATRLLWLAAALSLPGCGIDKLVSSPGADDDGGNGGGNGSAHLAFLVQPSSTPEGERITPDVQVKLLDQAGNIVTSFAGSIRLEIAANPADGRLRGGTERQAVSGIAVFEGLHINEAANGYTLRASASGVSSAVSASFNITRQRTDDRVIAVVSGSGQQDTVGATLGEPYVVQVRDGTGMPVPGVAIAWAVTGGGGVITPGVVSTDGGGLARATHQLGTGAGAQAVTASAAQVSGSPVTFTATARHGTPVRIVFLQQPSNAARDQRIAPPVRVRIVDQFENAALGHSGEVTIDIAPQSGTPSAKLRGTVSRIPSGGEVTFPDLRIDLPGLGYRLRVRSGSLVAESNSFIVL